MGSFTDYAENKVLDHIVGKTAFTMPTAYVALSTTTITDAGGNCTEPVGGSYARAATSGATWNAASAGSISNAGAISFPQASANWGTVIDFAVFDAAANGNMLFYGTLTVSKTIGSGDTASFAAGALTATLN